MLADEPLQSLVHTLQEGRPKCLNHLKSLGLVYNSRAGITAGTRFCCLQGAWFAGYFSIFQLWKFSLCRAVGNNDMTTTGPATMAASKGEAIAQLFAA